MKKFLALLLIVCVVFCFVACGAGDENPTQNPSSTGNGNSEPSATEPSATKPSATDPSPTEPSVTEPADYVYTVKVVDVDGNPVGGVFVQVCAGESCVPVVTDENGIAGYTAEVVGDGELKAKIITSTLKGYVCVDGVEEISMADGNVDVVFYVEKTA